MDDQKINAVKISGQHAVKTSSNEEEIEIAEESITNNKGFPNENDQEEINTGELVEMTDFKGRDGLASSVRIAMA